MKPQSEITPAEGDIVVMRYMHARLPGESLAHTNSKGVELSWTVKTGKVVHVFKKDVTPDPELVVMYYMLGSDLARYKFRHMFKAVIFDRVVTQLAHSRQSYHVWPWVKCSYYKMLEHRK